MPAARISAVSVRRSVGERLSEGKMDMFAPSLAARHRSHTELTQKVPGYRCRLILG